MMTMVRELAARFSSRGAIRWNSLSQLTQRLTSYPVFSTLSTSVHSLQVKDPIP